MMGVRFVKGQVDLLEENPDGSIRIRYFDYADGKMKSEDFDLVVLAVGFRPKDGAAKIFKNVKLELDEYGWIKVLDPNIAPNQTSIPGVFVAGTASGPKDIPDSIVDANSAAMSAAKYVMKLRGGRL